MYRQYQEYKQSHMATKSAASKLKCVIFLGSVRDNRLGLRVAKFMERQLQARNYETELFGMYTLLDP